MFSNSTISMSHISLDCGWRGTSVGRISSSRLAIENCPIISNPESSPFVIHNGWDDIGSSIFFVDCSHESIDKSSLLPLVSLAPSHMSHSRRTDHSQEVSSTLVSCSGLSLCDTDLVFGSGPLVGFSSSTEQNTKFWNKLETVLTGSRLVNMTSGEEKGALEGWRGSQKILGSCVTLSTNHLYGTTCIDMNLGGSLLCSNTSFSHCRSSLEPEFVENERYSLQHKTKTDQQKFYWLNIDDITFRRCTFLSMTSSSSGTAIYFYRSPGALTVTECSFSKCQATSSSGGAINFGQLPEKNTPIAISSSLFVDCTADRAAALYIFIASACTITNVVFQNLVASSDDGALYVSRADVYSLSNCAFKQCVAEDSSSFGGGMTLHLIPTLTMDSVLFRECSANRGNDIYCSGGIGTIEELSPNITNCDSTSDMPNVSANKNDSTLIPAVPDTSTASLVEIGSNPSADQTSSTIRMKVSNNVDGKMLVLVDNTNKHEPPNVDSPPTIARLLTFDFSTSTESATQEVSFGEWEELQYESEYCVIGSSIAKTRLSFSSSLALTTPNPARIVQIVCSLGSGTDHCWLEFKGRTLPIGTYTVKLVTVPDFSFSVSFDGSTGSNTLNMFSSRHSERLFGTGSKLSFSTKYEVESVTFEGSSKSVILDPPRLIFTTPAEQPRLISVGPVSFKDDSTKDALLIPLVGVDLPNGEYVLKLLSSSLESVSLPVTFSSSDSETIEVVVYSKDANEIKLKYGMTYTVEEMTSGTMKCLLETAFSIQVPAEPKRIEEGMVTLNPVKDEATVRLKGKLLIDGTYKLDLDSVSQELTSEPSLSEAEELLFKVPISPLPSSILSFGETYTISLLKIESESVIVNSNVKLVVPAYQLVMTAQVHPNSINTTMTLGLTGICLKLDGFYTVTLSPPFSFDMLFNSSTTASSPKMILGRANCLQHNTEYTIESITCVGDESDVIQTDGTVSFTTPTFPVPLILHVNEKEGKDDAFCGASDDPCATIDFAWSIVCALRAKKTLVIVNSSEQTQPILISSGMSLLFCNGGNVEPTLTVPSSTLMGDQAGMVVVSDATFSIVDVTVKIDSTDLSFVFLSASGSTIILKEGSFVGTPLSALSSNSESEEVCSWESGIVRVDTCITTLTRMTFTSLSQGAIHMKNGSVDVDGVIFRDNSPNLVAFPSARRNIRCVDGSVTIGSLNGGDGSKDHPSAWMSATDCILNGNDARRDSPLFVPTLSSNSTSLWNQKEKRFSVLIVGTTMIPCGLSLEVFEMKKDKSEGKSGNVELSSNTTDSFNETHINISVALTSLSSLDKTLEWRGRLVFGSNQTTSESFIIQKSSADRMAQSSLDNMKWWLPLVIVLSCCAIVAIIVIVVILRRRQKQKTLKDSETQQASPLEMDEEKIEVEQFDYKRGANIGHTSVDGLKAGSLDPERGDESTTLLTKQMNAPLSEFVSVLDCSMLEAKEMSKMETLFDRLHKNKTGIVGKRQRQIELARGLQKLGKLNTRADVLLRLSSHWILVDVDGRLSIQMNRGQIPSLGGQSHTNHSTATDSIVREETHSVNVSNENASGMNRAAKEVREKEDQEGQRWQAPEQGGNDGMQSIVLEKVTVFRLGLVLWEIETGQVPFQETDGVNAGRQLKSGVKPNMDLVQNAEMQELLLKCLELKPADRIALNDLISSLSSIPDDPAPTQQLFGS
ncbi:hypothetical protein BLNAU_17015 [Blattamonas nauphoetae]|uniref:Protein kinase domain-containing protein n=1 Tax=Blattamonas nauphoetae TaxID=2049346 RepID=A0ABQ9X7U1_9EUKA|nr:hypothetical protein BLNAU_17015 [Blattamonas nauphoetae]